MTKDEFNNSATRPEDDSYFYKSKIPFGIPAVEIAFKKTAASKFSQARGAEKFIMIKKEFRLSKDEIDYYFGIFGVQWLSKNRYSIRVSYDAFKRLESQKPRGFIGKVIRNSSYHCGGGGYSHP